MRGCGCLQDALRTDPATTRERRLFTAALVAWTLILLIGWLTDGPLGHDEAAYAIGGDALLRGHQPPWLYRSVGMHVIAALGVLAGGSDVALRAPAVVLAIGFLFAVRHAGRRLLGGEAGAWAAAIVVGTHALALHGHELLSDLPSTAALLMGAATLAGELARADGPRWRILAAAPWLAAAFYLRYASCVPIAMIVVGAGLVWGRRARALPLLATAGLLALLLVPHALHAIAETGSPLGIIRFSSGVPRRAYVGEGLATYLLRNPLRFYGVLAAPVLLAGLASVVRPPDTTRKPARYLWLVAVAQIVTLGLISHGVPRYIFFGLMALLVLGVDALGRLARAHAPRPALRRVALALVATSWLGVAIGVIAGGAVDDWRGPVVDAAAVLRRDAAGQPCHVVTHRFTQMMWYGACEVGDWTAPGAKLERGERVYRVWTMRSPGTPPLESFTAATPVPLDLIEIGADPGRYQVTRIERRR